MVELVELGESITAVLVVSSALFFLAMAVRAKSLRSFQAQISIFMLIWAASELPRILGTLGLLNVEAYEAAGLQFHFASMFIFAIFIVMRARYLFGEARLNEILDKSLYTGLAKVLEDSGAKAMRFYLDFSLVKKNPQLFASSLRKMFGVGSGVLEKRIVEALYSNAGLPLDTSSSSDLAQHILSLRARLKKV